jgi:DnaJ-class molecular chaperone
MKLRRINKNEYYPKIKYQPIQHPGHVARNRKVEKEIERKWKQSDNELLVVDTVTCPYCRGSGNGWLFFRCKTCSGHGVVPIVRCPDCKGSGKSRFILAFSCTCRTCGGAGETVMY